MGVVVWLVSVILEDAFANPSLVPRAVALALLVGSGLLVYAVGVLASGTLQVRQLRAMLRRRGPAA
jgi:hypothetical protein